jgi:amino-acid N-acetyltransferase
MPSVNVVVSGQPDQMSFEPPQDGPQRAGLPSHADHAGHADEGDGLVRRGSVADVPAIAALIEANLADGHLLPRTRDDLTRHAERFIVITLEGQVAGCAELAPLSRAVAEVRSLVVDEAYRGRGLGSQLVEELKRAARRDGFTTLCAFTHAPSHFIRLGFSMVPHPWLPEKIQTDCYNCPKFRTCEQYAMALALKGGSLRTSAAGQRPYLAMPPAVEIKTLGVKTGASKTSGLTSELKGTGRVQ